MIPDVLALLGDNPMQSELASHIGLTARLFCRVCWLGKKEKDGDLEDDWVPNFGRPEDGEDPGYDDPDDEDDNLDVPGEEMRSEVPSSPSASNGSGAESESANTPQLKETVKQLVARAKKFVVVRHFLCLVYDNGATDNNLAYRKPRRAPRKSQWTLCARYSRPPRYLRVLVRQSG